MMPLQKRTVLSGNQRREWREWTVAFSNFRPGGSPVIGSAEPEAQALCVGQYIAVLGIAPHALIVHAMDYPSSG